LQSIPSFVITHPAVTFLGLLSLDRTEGV
jgi:ABC-type proline/glycine betaine transport system permease subunit